MPAFAPNQTENNGDKVKHPSVFLSSVFKDSFGDKFKSVPLRWRIIEAKRLGLVGLGAQMMTHEFEKLEKPVGQIVVAIRIVGFAKPFVLLRVENVVVALAPEITATLCGALHRERDTITAERALQQERVVRNAFGNVAQG